MKRINVSNVSAGIAVTSLFVALGGPAQAASLVTGANVKNSSLTGADVKNSSLTGADVKGGSLTGSDVKGNSLTGNDITGVRGADVRDGSLTKADFAAGQLPAGPAGPKGDTGAAGPAGPSRWLLVDATGKIEAQSGGFRIANAYRSAGAGVADAANGNVYIESGDKDLSNNGIVATIALQNQVNQDNLAGNAGANDGNADGNPEFSGEISATKCAIAGVVACAPLDTGVTPNVPTNANNYFVVSPRLSDGQRTSDANSPTPNATSNRKRFYVVVSGPQD